MTRLFSGLAFLTLLAACGGGISLNVNTDYDPVAEPKMSAYRTWNWLAALPGSPPRADSGVAALVEQQVEDRLARLGYAKSDSAGGFRIGWHAGIDGALDVTTINAYYGYAWGRWFPGGGVAYSKGYHADYEPGSLVLDIADTHANELVWRGIARDVFRKNEKPGQREQLVAEAVRELLVLFPPNQKHK